jgi:hypothetical protein
MSDSVILVIVRSRFAGRKFFTPLMRVSKLAPTPVAANRSVSRFDMLLKPRNSSVEAEVWVFVGPDGVEAIIVMRVVARTLVRD